MKIMGSLICFTFLRPLLAQYFKMMILHYDTPQLSGINTIKCLNTYETSARRAIITRLCYSNAEA